MYNGGFFHVYIYVCIYNDVQCNIDIRDYIYSITVYIYIYTLESFNKYKLYVEYTYIYTHESCYDKSQQ